MPSPFKKIIFLKDGGEEIDVELILVPTWHLLATYISIGSTLIIPYIDTIDAFRYPILLLARSKWSLLHQFMASWFSPWNLIWIHYSIKTHEIIYETWSELYLLSCMPLFQCIRWSYRVHRNLVLYFGAFYLWLVFVYRV